MMNEIAVDRERKLEQQVRKLKRSLDDFVREPLHPIDLKTLGASKCQLCGNRELLVSSYPFSRSPLFARVILLHCMDCGISWSPIIPFDLDRYYATVYASEVQPFRKHAGLFYDKSNPFWQTKGAIRYRERAQEHIGLMKRFKPDFASVMDYGAGVGITLNELPPKVRRFASEMDENSQNILKGIGATLVDNHDRTHRYDVVLSSHSLEHGSLAELPKLLKWFYSVLNPGGICVIEVPRGFNLLSSALTTQGHGNNKQEPHTIFFSSASLYQLVKNAGFEIVGMGLCPWTRKKMAAEDSDMARALAKVDIGGEQPIAIAKRVK